MRPLCYVLAAMLAAAVMIRGMSGTGAAAAPGPEPERGAPPAEKPTIEVMAYVPTTTHVVGLGRGFSAVLEITNHSDVPLEILRRPHSEKVFEQDVKPLPPALRLGVPANGGAERILIVAQSVMPMDVALKGYSISGKRRRPELVSCGPGETVLMKVEVHKAVFQEGTCKLLFTLRARAGDANTALDIARSQPIPIEVHAADKRPVG